MHYYIDGYNLMFRVLRAGEDLKVQRDRVIDDLNSKIEFLELDATLVFDAHHQPGDVSLSHARYLKIIFTAQGETADEFILHELKSEPDPRQQTVVTSDKKLAWLARRQTARTESIEEFIAWLQKRHKNKLRHKKNEQKAPAKVTPTPMPKLIPLPEKPRKTEARAPQESVEASFDYYLNIFNEKSEFAPGQNPTGENAPGSSPKKEKKAKLVRDPEEEELSAEERWLRAFQRKLKPEDDMKW